MKFLIQIDKGRVIHDFAFTLLESIEYLNWISDEKIVTYRLTENSMPAGFVPIGTVEFVSDYIEKYSGSRPKPINIPAELMSHEFTHRHVKNGTELDIVQKSFVKSSDHIKSFAEICDHAPMGNYQISDIIEIESEWRAFVYNGKLVGLQNYSGSFTEFPNVYSIQCMINAYKSAPIAYTLDVAITKGGWTSVIEVHDFFSCGLYGFADHKILPFMFSRWYGEYIRNLAY